MSLVFKVLKKTGEEKKRNAASNTTQFRDYYVFTKESINAKAPPISGVYGLYNRKRYILIGESADIRRALLDHEKGPVLRFGLYRPIGFTFEVCSAELRAQRAEELKGEYHPVLQRRFAFARSRKPRKNQNVDAAATNATQHEDRSDPIAADPKAKDKRFYFFADQLVVVILALAVTAVAIGFLGLFTDRNIEPLKIVQVPITSLLEGFGSERRPPAPREQGAQTQGKTAETWTVQVKAGPDKSSAARWAAMLKTKGYDTFIVAGDIKGKPWYRVRVGHFDSRQEAETMRKILDFQEGFSDAFLGKQPNS